MGRQAGARPIFGPPWTRCWPPVSGDSCDARDSRAGRPPGPRRPQPGTPCGLLRHAAPHAPHGDGRVMELRSGASGPQGGTRKGRRELPGIWKTRTTPGIPEAGNGRGGRADGPPGAAAGPGRGGRPPGQRPDRGSMPSGQARPPRLPAARPSAARTLPATCTFFPRDSGKNPANFQQVPARPSRADPSAAHAQKQGRPPVTSPDNPPSIRTKAPGNTAGSRPSAISGACRSEPYGEKKAGGEDHGRRQGHAGGSGGSSPRADTARAEMKSGRRSLTIGHPIAWARRDLNPHVLSDTRT